MADDSCTHLLCTYCGELKPVDDFYRDRRNTRRLGRSALCKICNKERSLASAKKQRQDPDKRDKINFYQREWRANNREQSRELARRGEATRKPRPENFNKVIKLKVKYNISFERFEEMVKQQRGRCLICKKKQDKKLCVDHCHKSGRVRGLLCRQCNSGIGMLQDDPKLIKRALQYLDKETT